ncbi:MAG: GtrA family protein [Bacteroidetes bacterium]|nr:MAG: GtrA family protein [Bacteroidota bacterium]
MSKLSHLPDLQKQLIKFAMIGVLAVLVDLVCYYILLNLLPEVVFDGIPNESVAKFFSFLCGMSVTYTFNKLWTWKKNDRSKLRMFKFMLLYGFSLGMNVASNSFFLYVLHEYSSVLDLPYKYFIAFVGATGISACINFVGQKFWVFREDRTAGR